MSAGSGWEAGIPARHFQQVLAGTRLSLQPLISELLAGGPFPLSSPFESTRFPRKMDTKWTPNGPETERLFPRGRVD